MKLVSGMKFFVLMGLFLSLTVGFINAQSVTVDCATEYQVIRGFGGMNMPSWIADLTTDQVNLAFGNNTGQLGLTILRVKVPTDAAQFYKEYPAAATARSLGALVFATPWSPPASMKSNSSIVGGTIKATSYSDYTAHLLSFATYMKNNKAALYAVSLQNEPDYSVTYESCNWKINQMIDFLKTQGSKFDTLKVIAPESFCFNRTRTDSILNNTDAALQMDIVGGHIYGGGLSDYALARQKAKEVWMTEHFTESLNTGNTWPLALDVASELHNCMAANFNAYIWWYIRRSYGLIDESGVVTKRGYLMAQFAKFARPGYIRVASTITPAANVFTTAYKSDSSVVIVVLNKGTNASTIHFTLKNKDLNILTRYTTSETKNVYNEGTVSFSGEMFSATVDAQSTSTFVLKKSINNGLNDVLIPKLSIYPNPANKSITLTLEDQPISVSKGSIYNQMGVVVCTFSFNSHQFDVDISNLPANVYQIKILMNNRTYIRKFIKK